MHGTAAAVTHTLPPHCIANSSAYLQGCQSCLEQACHALGGQSGLDDSTPEGRHFFRPVLCFDGLEAISLEELLIVIDGAPLGQVVCFADAI